MYKTETPLITSALVEELHVLSATPKPTAKGTPLRYSSAFGCARQQGYAGLGVEPTEPMDEAGAWATGLGTIIHEKLQDSISRKFPSAQFEVASQLGAVSGSCDAPIPVSDFASFASDVDLSQGTHVLYELKTMGTYSFDKQVGWNRMRGTQSEGEGPAMKAVAQAGINALGIEQENPDIRIEWLVMGSITFEALSKNKAANMGVDGTNRFLAEFYVPRSEWEWVAKQELARMESIASVLDQGYLADRFALDDNGDVLALNPNIKKFWQCDYCAFRTVCEQDGGGQVRIIDSVSATGKENQ